MRRGTEYSRQQRFQMHSIPVLFEDDSCHFKVISHGSWGKVSRNELKIAKKRNVSWATAGA